MDMFCYLRKETKKKNKSEKGRQKDGNDVFAPQTVTKTILTDKFLVIVLPHFQHGAKPKGR